MPRSVPVFLLREQVLENYGLIFLCLRRWLVLVDLLRGAGVAPVRGSTYFLCPPRGLPSGRQRKESKQRKRAHTANPGFYPRALSVPMFHTATCCLGFIANALTKCLTRFKHPHDG